MDQIHDPEDVPLVLGDRRRTVFVNAAIEDFLRDAAPKDTAGFSVGPGLREPEREDESVRLPKERLVGASLGRRCPLDRAALRVTVVPVGMGSTLAGEAPLDELSERVRI